METLEIKNKNKKVGKLAWLLVFIFGALFVFSFFNGERIHEKAVINERSSDILR